MNLNRLLIPVLATALLLIAIPVSAEEPAAQEPEKAADTQLGEQVKADLEALFDACKNDRFEKAAPLISYRRGPQRERRFKDTYNIADEEERKHVERGCKDIKEVLEASQSYKFVAFSTEGESEGLWHIWKVIFQLPDGPREFMFALLKIKGRFAVGDIDD